ncbi:MAG: MFS transporter, partial [Dehalococcoidia bacterium]|nr:MFS transporter [Dehalococcoidia bacterium]
MAFAIFAVVTSLTMVGPLLVDMSAALATTVPLVGQLVTIAAATWALTALVAGPFSDTYGRKPVLVVGTCFVAIASLGTGLAPSLPVAAGFRVLAGIGGGMVPPTCIALIGDIFPEKKRPMSVAIITMQPGMSSVLGVPLAAVAGDFAGWRFPFLVIGVALFLAAIFLFFVVPHQRPLRTGLEFVQRLRRVAVLPLTLYTAGANLITRITWGTMVTFFPAFLQMTYGLGTAGVALPVAAVAIGATLAPLLGGMIGSRTRRLTIAAALLLVAVVPGLGLFQLEWGVWFSVFTAGLFMLLIVPITTILMILAADMGGPSRGTLSGIISSSNWAGTA